MSLPSQISPLNGVDTHGTRGHFGAAGFQVDAQPVPGGALVRPVGEIDLATVDMVRRKIEECIAAGCGRVVLDLRGVTFMDSTGLHLALDADAEARDAGWELQMVEGPRPVQRLFEITGLNDRLPFVDVPPG